MANPRPRTNRVPAPGGRTRRRWTDAQWKAALRPHRARILILMDGLGEATAYELAELTGRSASSIYKHLDALVAADLLSERSERRGGRLQRVFTRGPALKIPMVDLVTGAGGAQFGHLSAAALRAAASQAERFGRAVEDGGADAPFPTMMHVDVAWLDAAARRRVIALMHKVLAIARASHRGRTGARMQVVLCCFNDLTLRQLRARRGAAAWG
jgi:DNA-binding transcriptional ArsR family regulator